MMKNASYFTTFWSCRKNSFIRTIRLTSKFMTPQPGLQTIAIQKQLSKQRQADNETWSVNRISKRNIFLQKLCRK